MFAVAGLLRQATTKVMLFFMIPGGWKSFISRHFTLPPPYSGSVRSRNRYPPDIGHAIFLICKIFHLQIGMKYPDMLEFRLTETSANGSGASGEGQHE